VVWVIFHAMTPGQISTEMAISIALAIAGQGILSKTLGLNT
jgi:hypothetical protein